MEDTPLERIVELLRSAENPGKLIIAAARRLTAEGVLSGHLVATKRSDGATNASIYGTREDAIQMVMKLLPQFVKNEAVRQLIEMTLSNKVATFDCSKCEEREQCPLLKHHVHVPKPEEVN